jgi:hypothetical protein
MTPAHAEASSGRSRGCVSTPSPPITQQATPWTYTRKRVDEGTHLVAIDAHTSVVSPENTEGKAAMRRTRSKRSVMHP